MKYFLLIPFLPVFAGVVFAAQKPVSSGDKVNVWTKNAHDNFTELYTHKANASAFASQAAFTSAWGWAPGGVSAWSDIQALLTGNGTYVKADGTTGDPTGTITTGDGVAAAMANALDGTGGLASKAALDAKQNRVTGACGTGQAVQSVAADGTVTCGSTGSSLGYTPENAANKGVANGYASLGSDGLVPSSQLPPSTGTDDQTATEVPVTAWGSCSAAAASSDCSAGNVDRSRWNFSRRMRRRKLPS